jgi:WD40 repeat protein
VRTGTPGGTRSLSPLWELDLGACPEALALTADGRQLAIGSTEGSLRICDADTGLVHHARQAHTRGLSALACGGTLLASGGQDGALRLWCPDAGTLLAEAHFGRAWVEHLIFAPDSRALV